jgi:hypothetical protein
VNALTRTGDVQAIAALLVLSSSHSILQADAWGSIVHGETAELGRESEWQHDMQ